MWYWAISIALGYASNNVGSIVEDLQLPPPKTSIALNLITSIMSAGLSFIPGLAGIAAGGLKAASQVAVGMLSNGVAQAPNIARLTFPPPGPGSVDVQWSNLQSTIAKMSGMMSSIMSQANSVAQTQLPDFLQLVGKGAFSTEYVMTNINDSAPLMTASLSIYIASMALEGNNVHGTVTLNTDVAKLFSGGTKLAWTSDCSKGYDPQGICDS